MLTLRPGNDPAVHGMVFREPRSCSRRQGSCAPTGTELTHPRRHTTVGWEFVHVCVDDYSRLAYAEILSDEKATTAIAFLQRAVAFYRRHGITVERLLTDNGSCYRSTIHALACKALGITFAPGPTGHRQTDASSAPSYRAGLRRHLPLKQRTHPST